jgi:hypothetical protein
MTGMPRVPRTEAQERHAPIDDGCTTLQESYGQESKRSSPGHALMENRNGLITAAMGTHADEYADRNAARLLLEPKQGSLTLIGIKL